MAESKKYCCSNYLRFEAFVAAIFDTTLSALAVCIITVFHFLIDESRLNSIENENFIGLEDLKRFIKLDSEIRELAILIVTTLIILHILMNTLLLTGIFKRNSIIIKVWFVTAIVTYLIALAMFFNVIYFTHDKIVHSLVFGFYIVFYIYFLWVIKMFLKELASVGHTTSEEQLNQEATSQSIDCSESIESKKY